MSVESCLSDHARLLEPELARLLPGEDLLQREVIDACRYSLLGGGKRLRPALLLEFCALAGGSAQHALPFACAIEMIHTYSLIHDDLPCMDDDDLRRGKPSCHRRFSECTAVLAGDGLLNRAFELMLAHDAGVPPERALKAAGYMARMSGLYGMIGGQLIDTRLTPRTLEEHRNMVDLKTGALFRAACVCGALLGGASDALIADAERYAQAFGLAFQLRDDLLDVYGDEQVIGKRTGNDMKNNKYTFIDAYGPEGCERLLAQLTEQAARAVSPHAGSEFLIEIARWNKDRAH